MDKAKGIEHFTRAYGQLTETDKAIFSRICNKLLSASFLCAAREADRSDYFETVRYFGLYQEYFAIIDYEVINYSADRVIQLKSTENYNHLNLKLNESVILLLLRKLYAVKSRELSLNENVVVTIEEVHDSVSEIGWLDRRLNKTDFRNIIRLLKRFSLIENIGELEKDDTMLVLYPSLSYAVPYEAITDIDQQIKNYGREEENEASDEDTAD